MPVDDVLAVDDVEAAEDAPEALCSAWLAAAAVAAVVTAGNRPASLAASTSEPIDVVGMDAASAMLRLSACWKSVDAVFVPVVPDDPADADELDVPVTAVVVVTGRSFLGGELGPSSDTSDGPPDVLATKSRYIDS
ncbi:MAG: hypothetical protein R2715_17615 [Ilumatobacteraceae bacterium]